MNVQDLDRSGVNTIVKAREDAAMEVQSYENSQALPPIEGVYLHFERGL
jgi:hypothetical protein